MKKLLAAILSVVMCTAMFTACSKESTDSTETSDVTTTTESVMETEFTTTGITGAVTEPEIKNSYESIADFVISDPFKLETETVDGSLFSDYMEKNISDEGMYFDMETPDGKNKMLLAYKDSNMCIKVEGNGDNIYVYVLDGKMYILDSAEKTGFSMEMDQDTVESLKDEAMGGMDLDSAAAEVDKSQCVDVEIDGEAYTFENLEEIGVLFHKNGDIYAVLNGGKDEALQILLVNEMSSNVPEGILKLPEDYEIIDMTEFLSGLEDYDTEDSGEAAKTEFATMEEFLEADLSKFNGTEYSADKAFSAEMFRIMSNPVNFYYSVESFDGEYHMETAVCDGKVMISGDGGWGENINVILEGDKVYIVEHSEKMVLVTSADETMSAEIIIDSAVEEFKNYGENDRKYTITEIKIAGKKYFIEVENGDDDSGMLYNADKTLYAAVINLEGERELYKWIISEDIPAGTFDIPSDYEVVNLDELE